MSWIVLVIALVMAFVVLIVQLLTGHRALWLVSSLLRMASVAWRMALPKRAVPRSQK
ncbi:MAG TPA: hypothetical protein VFV93_12865 [Thermomicrobiales bacterium]|nr:hypothetical protein [Thermomicrobiales bacterium]